MWYIILAVYVLIGILAYIFVFSNWSKSLFEKIWYSVFWIAVLVANIVHRVYNYFKKD